MGKGRDDPYRGIDPAAPGSLGVWPEEDRLEHFGYRLKANDPRNAEQPEVSVVTVALNCASYLEATLDSLARQTCRSFEHVVVDGGSSDGTVEVARRRADRIAYCVSAPDRGIGDAFNRGLRLARGRMIGYLNAGDAYAEEALERVAEARRRGADLVYGSSYKSDPETGEPLYFVASGPWRRPYAGTPFRHSGVFASAGLFRATGYFDERYRLAMDMEFFYKAFHFAERIERLDATLSYQRMGGASQKQFARALREAHAIHRRYSGRSRLFLRWIFLRGWVVRVAERAVDSTAPGRRLHRWAKARLAARAQRRGNR